MARRLQGKVALITGGASGIGARTAVLFARHGARVVIADEQADKAHALCASLGPAAAATFVHCDVTSEPDVERAVDAAVSRHGGLDIMLNSAGVGHPPGQAFLDGELDTATIFERVMSVNVLGVLLGTKHAARVMAPARRGSIVTTACTGSGLGGLASPVYACAKHAVVGLTRSAAAELWRFGVRVNCVSPFLELHASEEEVERVAEASANLKGVALKAEDVAEAVVYLGSDESRLEGKIAVITGGASGIGESTARLFVHHGARVIVADVQDNKGRALCSALGPDVATFVHCNVTDESHVMRAVDAAVSRHGKLDIMFNNAGVVEHAAHGFLNSEDTAAVFARVMGVNVLGDRTQ